MTGGCPVSHYRESVDMPGTLFVVATPIGNLEDLTFRALRTLRSVDLIAAEDTRRTAKLMAHYEIQRPVTSLREHNEARQTLRLLDRIAAGESIALVSDAGTPTIADPGARLVRAAHERQLPVVPIPGPSAIVTALSVSGLSGDQFVFLGFPPASGAARRKWLESLAKETRVAVFFEAPHRIRRTLAEVRIECGERPIMTCRELSKIYEELVVKQNVPVESIKEAGEFTIVVGGTSDASEHEPVDRDIVFDSFCRLTNKADFSRDEAVSMISGWLGIRPDVTRKIVKKSLILAKQQNMTRP
jgi:16S rRNA (cytidine1402-2'-O)-methyltransferase